jgi:hypothetical protein
MGIRIARQMKWLIGRKQSDKGQNVLEVVKVVILTWESSMCVERMSEDVVDLSVQYKLMYCQMSKGVLVGVEGGRRIEPRTIQNNRRESIAMYR